MAFGYGLFLTHTIVSTNNHVQKGNNDLPEIPLDGGSLRRARVFVPAWWVQECAGRGLGEGFGRLLFVRGGS